MCECVCTGVYRVVCEWSVGVLGSTLKKAGGGRIGAGIGGFQRGNLKRDNI